MLECNCLWTNTFNNLRINILRNNTKNYINHIHRITKYFFSSNHEYFRNHFKNNEKSLINSEFNMQNKFKELIRYPDLGHLTYENNKIDMDSDIFFYIYQKN